MTYTFSRIIISIALLFLVSLWPVNTLFAQCQCDDLQQRIKALEEKVRILESRSGVSQTPVQSSSGIKQSDKDNDGAWSASDNKSTAVSQQQVKSDPKSIVNLVRARLFTKKQNAAESAANVAVLIAMTNSGYKDIASFKGTVVFFDSDNSKLLDFLIEFTRPIRSLSSESWYGEVPADPSNEGYKKFLSMKAEDIKTSITLSEVVFSDGTKRTSE